MGRKKAAKVTKKRVTPVKGVTGRGGKGEGETLASSPLLGPVIAGLVELRDEATIKKKIAAMSGLPANQLEELIRLAKEKIVLAASCDKKEECGLAKLQLNRLFETCLDSGDTKTALATRKELSKFLGLYDAPNAAVVDETFRTETEILVREHLENLRVTPAELPLEELARQVALFFCDHFKEEISERTSQLDSILAAQGGNGGEVTPPVAVRTRNRASSAGRKSKKKGKRKK